MTYNVFSGTLDPTQSINSAFSFVIQLVRDDRWTLSRLWFVENVIILSLYDRLLCRYWLLLSWFISASSVSIF